MKFNCANSHGRQVGVLFSALVYPKGSKQRAFLSPKVVLDPMFQKSKYLVNLSKDQKGVSCTFQASYHLSITSSKPRP